MTSWETLTRPAHATGVRESRLLTWRCSQERERHVEGKALLAQVVVPR
nr:hypothetical protein [Actinomyces sp.]